MINLSGCLSLFRSNSRTEMLNEDYKSEIHAISDVETEVIKALNTKDKKLLKSIFSQKAICAAEDIDIGIDYLFSIYEGDLVEISGRNHSSEEHIEAAGRTKMISAWCYIKTTLNTYKLSYLLYSVNEMDSSHKGVYRLSLYPEENLRMMDYDKFRIAGIDYPDREIVHTTTSAILDCLRDRKTDDLRGMFSTQALSEADDFNAGAQYVFDMFDGASVIGDYDSWLQLQNANGDKRLEAFIVIKTKYDDYVLYFNMGQNEGDVGKLYRLKLTKVHDPQLLEKHSLGDAYERYGIYYPMWDVN